MSKSVYISASSQPSNTYAVGNTNEQEQCRKIAAALKEELDRCGFVAHAGITGTMYTRTAESNKLNVDLHLPLHTNACDGKVAGLRIMVSKKGGEAEKIAKAIMDTLAPITPGKSDGISTYPGLYEIANTKAICVYLEVGFHDNKEEAQWIIDHTREIAIAIAKGLCNHYGVAYVPEEPAEEAPVETPEQNSDVICREVIYRVQVGAFKNRSYAEALLEKLKAAGFTEAYIQK